MAILVDGGHQVSVGIGVRGNDVFGIGDGFQSPDTVVIVFESAGERSRDRENLALLVVGPVRGPGLVGHGRAAIVVVVAVRDGRTETGVAYSLQAVVVIISISNDRVVTFSVGEYVSDGIVGEALADEITRVRDVGCTVEVVVRVNRVLAASVGEPGEPAEIVVSVLGSSKSGSDIGRVHRFGELKGAVVAEVRADVGLVLGPNHQTVVIETELRLGGVRIVYSNDPVLGIVGVIPSVVVGVGDRDPAAELVVVVSPGGAAGSGGDVGLDPGRRCGACAFHGPPGAECFGSARAGGRDKW